MVVVAIAVVAIRYARKRPADRAVHRMHEQVRDERQLELEQLARREAQKCTYATELTQKLEELVAAASGSMRVGLESLEAGRPYAPTCAIDGGEPGCQSHVELIERLLFEQRAMLPPAVFGLMHEVRMASVAFEATARRLSEDSGDAARRRRLRRLRDQFEQVDTLYRSLVDEVRGFLGGCARAS